MLRLDNNRYSFRMDLLIDGVGDLSCQPLLHLQPAGIHIDESRNLAEAHNTAVWDIADVTFAEKRQQMMLAETEHLDVANDDHFIVRNIEKRLAQDVVCIHAVTACQKPHRPIDA